MSLKITDKFQLTPIMYYFMHLQKKPVGSRKGKEMTHLGNIIVSLILELDIWLAKKIYRVKISILKSYDFAFFSNFLLHD